MVENLVIVIIFPVDTVGVNIFEAFIISWMDASWAILDHAKEKHIVRATLTLAMYGDGMVVPCLSPFKGILIDGIQKEMVEEPYVSIGVTV